MERNITLVLKHLVIREQNLAVLDPILNLGITEPMRHYGPYIDVSVSYGPPDYLDISAWTRLSSVSYASSMVKCAWKVVSVDSPPGTEGRQVPHGIRDIDVRIVQRAGYAIKNLTHLSHT